MAQRVVGLGAGGHARVVLEILHASSQWMIDGLVDPDPELQGTDVLGVPVLGNDDHLPALIRHGVTHFFVGVGDAGGNRLRKKLYHSARALGLLPTSAVHSRAMMSPSAVLGSGATVMAASVINTLARIGENVIVNSGAIIEHDCAIQDHAHVATGATLCGGVHVGEGAHIGAGATVLPGVRIGSWAVVGGGAAVIQDVADGATVVGVPARPLPKHGDSA